MHTGSLATGIPKDSLPVAYWYFFCCYYNNLLMLQDTAIMLPVSDAFFIASDTGSMVAVSGSFMV